MKKILILILFIIIPLFISCESKDNKTITNNDINIINETSTEVVREIHEVDYELVNELLNLIKKCINGDYIITSSGTTVAKKGLITYKQISDSVETKNDNEYKVISKSNSLFVKLYHEAFFNDDNVKYRTKEDSDFIDLSVSDYKEIYGVIPYENFLNYIVNSDTIISIEKNDSIYKVVLDNELSTVNSKIQMKTFGDLKDYPEFTYLEMIITCDDKIRNVIINANYNINVNALGSMNANMNLSIDFNY